MSKKGPDEVRIVAWEAGDVHAVETDQIVPGQLFVDKLTPSWRIACRGCDRTAAVAGDSLVYRDMLPAAISQCGRTNLETTGWQRFDGWFWCPSCRPDSDLGSSSTGVTAAQTDAAAAVKATDSPPHPVQPLVADAGGMPQSKSIPLVRFLLDKSPFNMRDLDRLSLTDEDREQLAQLVAATLRAPKDDLKDSPPHPPHPPHPLHPPHPVQPLVADADGTMRFKSNAIVRFLLDNGPYNMNDLARMSFTDEDREQFAQLIGYSRNGFGELAYVREDTWDRANSPADSEVAGLLQKLDRLRELAKPLVTALFRVHKDDLKG